MARKANKRLLIQENEPSTSQQSIGGLEEIEQIAINYLAEPENEEEKEGLENLLNEIRNTENRIRGTKPSSQEGLELETQQTSLQSLPNPLIKEATSSPSTHRRKLAAVSEQKEDPKWLKKVAQKQHPQGRTVDQRSEMLVEFCREHLQMEEKAKAFQTKLRDFLNSELPELKDKPIREETWINFSILGSETGKSTSAYFYWTQDGVADTKTMGIARYLNKTRTTDIPR